MQEHTQGEQSLAEAAVREGWLRREGCARAHAKACARGTTRERRTKVGRAAIEGGLAGGRIGGGGEILHRPRGRRLQKKP